MRRAVKTVAERMLLHGGPAALSRWALRERGLVLAYHNIVPEGQLIVGDESLHLPRRQFAEQLDLLLASRLRVVSLDELMDDLLDPEVTDPSPRVAITFDDAYRGAVEAGVEELVRRDLPATIFVVPGLVGGQTFWWDAISASAAGLKRRTRDAAIEVARGRNEEVIAWARRQGVTVGTVPEHARSADEKELHAAAAHEGIRMASHTWSHPNLARLSEVECRSEFVHAADWLKKRFGDDPRWLSYPYGLHGEAAEQAAAATDHRGAFRIEGGWLPSSLARLDVFRLPRLNVPAGLSPEGFSLRIAGLLCG